MPSSPRSRSTSPAILLLAVPDCLLLLVLPADGLQADRLQLAAAAAAANAAAAAAAAVEPAIVAAAAAAAAEPAAS